MGQPPVAVATHRRFTAAPPNIQALHRRCIHSSRASSYLAHRPVDDALRCSYALEHRTRRRSRIGCKGDGESVESVSKCEAGAKLTDAIFTSFFFPPTFVTIHLSSIFQRSEIVAVCARRGTYCTRGLKGTNGRPSTTRKGNTGCRGCTGCTTSRSTRDGRRGGR